MILILLRDDLFKVGYKKYYVFFRIANIIAMFIGSKLFLKKIDFIGKSVLSFFKK